MVIITHFCNLCEIFHRLFYTSAVFLAHKFTKGSVMRKLIAASLMVLTLSATSTVLATPSTPAASEPTKQATNGNMPSSFVDNIEIPYDVWIYAQTQYQGLAITHANKVNGGGKQAYRVRLDHDSNSEDSKTSMYLFYDVKWQLTTEEKTFTPPPSQLETPQPTAEENKAKELKADIPEPQSSTATQVTADAITTQPVTTTTSILTGLTTSTQLTQAESTTPPANQTTTSTQTP